MQSREYLKRQGAWIVIIVLLLLYYFIFDPIETSVMPQCIFRRVTGLQCMGCGAQRVIHHLLHGDLSGAFQANAFIVCSLPFLIFYLWAEKSRTKHPALYKKLHSLPIIISVAALLIVWFIFRNIYGI